MAQKPECLHGGCVSCGTTDVPVLMSLLVRDEKGKAVSKAYCPACVATAPQIGTPVEIRPWDGSAS